MKRKGRRAQRLTASRNIDGPGPSVVRAGVNVDVTMRDFDGWTSEQIEAFMAGVAAVRIAASDHRAQEGSPRE